jgi:hypothetical protein
MNHLANSSAQAKAWPTAGSSNDVNTGFPSRNVLRLEILADGATTVDCNNLAQADAPRVVDGHEDIGRTPEWDKSTQVGASSCADSRVGDLLAGFPDLKLVHSAQSLKAVVERQAALRQARAAATETA